MGTESGYKDDSYKVKMGLIIEDFPRALEEVGKVATFGANKYTEHGWLTVENGKRRYTDAMYRHALAEARGEVFDYESNLYHAAHLAWNALARLELILRQEEEEWMKKHKIQN